MILLAVGLCGFSQYVALVSINTCTIWRYIVLIPRAYFHFPGLSAKFKI